MNDVIDFFLAPYATASSLDIALEIIAVGLGILSVWYAKKENILVFPTGIISTVLYVYICVQYTLYGDVIINTYYTLMSLYGWYMWHHSTKGQAIGISIASAKDWSKVLIIFSTTTLFVILVYLYFNRFNQLTDYFDTFTTGIFFAAMWLMAHKKIEHWLFWILGNIISIPLYFTKGLGFSGLQFSVFLILALQGYLKWKKRIINTQPAASK
jgi:nicotinamide mononucleotide transporter